MKGTTKRTPGELAEIEDRVVEHVAGRTAGGAWLLTREITPLLEELGLCSSSGNILLCKLVFAGRLVRRPSQETGGHGSRTGYEYTADLSRVAEYPPTQAYAKKGRPKSGAERCREEVEACLGDGRWKSVPVIRKTVGRGMTNLWTALRVLEGMGRVERRESMWRRKPPSDG